MSYVIYSINIELMPPLVRCPSKEKKQKSKVLHPFRSVQAINRESYICPFCGKVMKEFDCDCREFKRAFKKLQESHNDHDHKSNLHNPLFPSSFGYERKIESIHIKKLDKKEIESLGPDFWDYADRSSDHFCECSYLVSPGKYEDNKISFVCKDLQTKRVYRCTMNDITISGLKVCLGVWRRKTVSHGLGPNGEIRYGNYHFENGYKDIVTFENWEQFCKVILAM